MLFVLVTNLLDRPEQYRGLMWLIMVVLTLNALAALGVLSLALAEREALESLGEHGAAVHAAALIVFIAATGLFRDRAGFSGRWVLLVMAVPVTWAFMLSERRGRDGRACSPGWPLVMLVLRWHQPRRFWLLLPVVVLVLTAYLGAFWNASGAPGFPAQAVKSVVAPEQQSEEDQASDLYRDIERHDIIATIRSNPVARASASVSRSYMPWPLPNISFFVFWEYITHNSILWIWMKAGIGGFVAMLMLFATALRTGARALVRHRRRDEGRDAHVGGLRGDVRDLRLRRHRLGHPQRRASRRVHWPRSTAPSARDDDSAVSRARRARAPGPAAGTPRAVADRRLRRASVASS